MAVSEPSIPADADADAERDEARDEQRSEANAMIGMGATIGAIGALSALTVGAVCPVCIVATPALLGAGLYKRLRARKPR